MVRSLTRHNVSRTFATTVAFLLALVALPLTALPAMAAGTANIDVYDQCFTGDPAVPNRECAGWTNGILNDSNSDYAEDEVTPQRLVTTFAEAGTHTIDISYLTYDHNVHAYDSLATWNYTLTGADRCQDLVDATDCVAGTPTYFPIPLDTTIHHDAGVGESELTSDHQLTGQQLELHGGTLTGAQYLGLGTYGPDYQTLQVTLTTTAPDQQVMLLFGGHIAATFGPRGWGERANGKNLGAAQVPGGSYHIRITAINEEAIGNRDNQLMSGAIEPPAETGIVTNATAGPVTIGGSITDTATITPSNAVGTVDFAVYGPDDATCSGTPVFTSDDRAVVAGTATSAAFTPTAVGTYRWIASFTPTDPTKFDAVSGACNDANESSVIVKAQPGIVTDAEDAAQLLSANPDITDEATVSNLTSDAGGTVTFNLYGPDDETCTSTAVFTSTVPLGTVSGGSATVTSGAFAATAAGTYRWIASYSGDAKNEAVSGACNDANESSVVLPTSPTITTDADDTAKLPHDATISDTATLSGVTANAGGTITFKLFGPDATPGDPTCTEGAGGNLVYTSSAVTVTGPGSYGPVETTVTKAGTYFWIAYYSGDANNSAVAGVCGDPTETSEVGVATPAIETRATNAQLPGDSTISDVASLTGLTSDATGTVTFNVWGPFALNATAVCAGSPFATRVVALPVVGTDNAVAVGSGNVTITNAGRYFWVASYSGDANNAPVTGGCGDEGETSSVNPTNPELQTTATRGTLPVGSITDSASLTGVTPDAGGTITFRLYGPSTAPDCSGTPIFTSAAVAVNGPGTYGPISTTADDAGSYYWIASYSGDGNNNAVTGACGEAGETSVVDKASPRITTTATETAQLPAGTLSDTAHLTGLTSSATGTVVFRLYGPDATPGTPTCTGAAVYTSQAIAININGIGTATATSGSFTPLSAGTYFWIATYSGDANNNGIAGACGDEGETSVVSPAEPTIATSASGAQLLAGTIDDDATVSGLSANATGSVTFSLYGPSETAVCTSTPVFTSTVALGTVTGGVASANSGSFEPAAAGNYYWIASYSGDANNLAVAGACGDEGETSVVTRATTAITTEVADSTVTLGTNGVGLVDTADLSGASSDAGGFITFTLYGPFASLGALSCSGEGAPIPAEAVSGSGTYTSDAVTVLQAGYYTWLATYSGDSNNIPAEHACGLSAETVLVERAQPDIATQATSARLPAGSLHDVATVTRLTSNATGTVTFSLWDNTGCLGAPLSTSVRPLGAVDGGTATVTSATYLPVDAVDHFWIAAYSGDANNNPVAGACGDEGETSDVDKARPTISTEATPTTRLPDGSLADRATLTGVTSEASGTVVFRLYGPDATPETPTCTDGQTGNLVYMSAPIDIVNTGGATATAQSPTFTPTRAGTYFWVAAYSGDANNEGVSGACGDPGETSGVQRARPVISTVATSAALPAGTVHDVATVSGLTSDATGTVSFALYGPAAAPVCTTAPIFTSTLALGTITAGLATVTSASFTPTVAGSYYWIAAYSGDANNEPITGLCGDVNETSVVAPATPAVVTDAADAAPATVDGLGVTLSDTAVVSGATSNASGTITFTVYGPFATSAAIGCTGTGIGGGTVTINGNGTYSSASVAVTQPGFYTWIASYSGDANNRPATHACGLAAETVEFRPSLDKTSVPAADSVVQPGSQIAYSVTVTNTGNIALTNAPVVDVLPANVAAVAGTISDGGTLSADGKTITWTVSLAAGATKTLTYSATVAPTAPQGATLVNTARFLTLQDTTTHVVATGALSVVKSVSPSANDDVIVQFGDILTYTLTVTATGTLTQPNVLVTDYVPGFDPARTTSGKTTYVTGSAACIGLGTCTVSEPSADNAQRITWAIGEMAAGTTRDVTFQVTIDRPAPAADGAIAAVDILNAGAVESTLTPRTPSNEVVTPVTEVLGVKIPAVQPKALPKTLPKTGVAAPLNVLVGSGLGLVALGLLLMIGTGPRVGRHRA